jgi:acyl carrier protein
MDENKTSSFDKTQVEKELKELISEMLICTPDDINIDTNLVDDLGGDSLDVVNVVMHIEQKYGLRIDNDETLTSFRTFGGMLKYVTEHLQEKENNDDNKKEEEV